MQKDDSVLHQKFVQYGANAKEWMRKCVLLLPEIEKKRIWEKKGFSCIYEYAAKLAGMSRDQVNEALRILKKIEDKPALQKVVEQKGLSAIKPVVTIATADNAEFWAEKAATMSKNTLEMYVRDFRKEQEAGLPRKPELETVTMDLNPDVLSKLQKLKGASDWNTLMQQLLELHSLEIEEAKPLPVETESRHIPAQIQRHVVARTNGQCAYPGCTRSYKILHHTQRFALEKVHDPARLQPLCKAHERIAHAGLIENEEEEARLWALREHADQTLSKYGVDRVVREYRKTNIVDIY